MASENPVPQLQKVHVTQSAKPSKEHSWQSLLTIDVLYSAALKTILHPFVAFMIPMSLRAVTVPYSNISMQVSIAYASLLTFWWILSVFNKRVAFGLPREVDLDEEVIVITGGSSGLGRLIANFYAMRGANVAVLDVVKKDDDDMMGLQYYECDIGDRKQVEIAAAKIRKDVRRSILSIISKPPFSADGVKLGEPTILINNAAIVNGKSILDLSTEEVEKNFRVNLLSHYHTVQCFLPGMLEAERGTIVTVASVLGYLGCANLCKYSHHLSQGDANPNSSRLHRSQSRSYCLPRFLESGTWMFSSSRGGTYQDSFGYSGTTGNNHVWRIEDTLYLPCSSSRTGGTCKRNCEHC